MHAARQGKQARSSSVSATHARRRALLCLAGGSDKPAVSLRALLSIFGRGRRACLGGLHFFFCFACYHVCTRCRARNQHAHLRATQHAYRSAKQHRGTAHNTSEFGLGRRRPSSSSSPAQQQDTSVEPLANAAFSQPCSPSSPAGSGRRALAPLCPGGAASHNKPPQLHVVGSFGR